MSEPSLKDDKAFEISLRRHLDSKYEREPSPDNPMLRLIQGQLPIEDCRRLYLSMWPSLQVFNRVLLPRLLERAPTLPLRVELMSVVALEYSGQLEEAHPVLFTDFLRALGVDSQDISETIDLEAGPWSEEVAALRGMSWCELLARMLVGESVGPVVFPTITAALKRSYGLSDYATYYFTLHSTHDKKDTEILIDLIRREASTEADREAVLRTIDRSFDQGRYALYGCRLYDPRSRYSYARQFERRVDPSRDPEV